MPAQTAMPQISTELIDALKRLVDKPLGYVHWAYTWGEGVLADDDGPDQWQRTALLELEEALRRDDTAAQLAIASGHGIGKGALVAWIIQWCMGTRPNLQGVTTANTQAQLMTKTWRELAKWHNLLRPELKQLFTWTASKYYHNLSPETWYVSAIPWSERNAEAFQGAHDRHVLLVFDESSAIPDLIWEAADGSMTTPRAIRIATGNPTRTEGRFRACFPGGHLAHRWITQQVDSRTCRKTNKRELSQWVEDYGEDSDFVRVRVRGVFPRASTQQFIGDDLIALAHGRHREALPPDMTLPKVLGVDVARYGDDRTVLLMRQGPRILRQDIYREINTMQTASYVNEIVDEVDAVFIDVVGIGAGVVDRLHQLGHRRKVVGVSGAQVASDAKRYYNKRAEMWDGIKKWLKEWGELDPADRDLPADLTGIQYGYDMRERLQLEKKDDMKKRGLASPDLGDALSLTFAERVAQPEQQEEELVLTIGEYQNRWMA